MVFGGLVGRAEIWIDGERAATKQGFGNASMEIALRPGSTARVVTILVESEPGVPGGLAQPVSVRDN